MIMGHMLVAVTLVAILISVLRLYKRMHTILQAAPANRTDNMMSRIGFTLAEVLTHRGLLRFKLSGIAHFLIFFSFLVLLTPIFETYFDGYGVHLKLFDYLAPIQDLAGITMIIGVGLALYNRLVIKPERFKGSDNADAIMILILILCIVITMELYYGFVGAITGYSNHFLATAVVSSWAVNLNPKTLSILHDIALWLHELLVLAFLIYIPGSKHLHMFFAIPNILFKKTIKKGNINRTMPDADEDGIESLTQLTRKDVFDLFACTECGRCQSVCPAHSAGLPLNPKALIMDLRDFVAQGGVLSGPNASDTVAGQVISPETLWACTTCHACVDICPVHIEHVPKIIDLRSQLVDSGEIPDTIKKTLTSYDRYGNSFKKPAKSRAKWVKKLDFDIPNPLEEKVEYLWFVGDFASFHPTVQEKTIRLAKLLNMAGVSFGILYGEEKSAGNDLRRLGEEGLYRELAETNINTLKEAQFDKILTSDPHTYNTIRNEYPSLGFDVPILHHSGLLSQLVASGKLKEPNPLIANKVATFHDPCYLGRYNGEFSAPRSIITGLGYKLQEMRRNKANSFCCGAGGGRIFMEDKSTKQRPSEERIFEALEIENMEVFVVACPKDVVMYTSAVDNVGKKDEVFVAELTDLFALPE